MTRKCPNHIYYMLQQLRSASESKGWMLATVVTKYRSSYRQPGAMMLLSPFGESLGLVSGGCLEANIRLQGRQVLFAGEAKCIVYDSTDEENIAAELNLGCNGKIEVLLQELKAKQLEILLKLLDRMEAGESSYLMHCFESKKPEDLGALSILDADMNMVVSSDVVPGNLVGTLKKASHQVVSQDSKTWSVNQYLPPVRLWVFGAGVDAQPLVRLAVSLGWLVTVVDHRVTNAREADFPDVEAIIRIPPDEFDQPINTDAVILMSHNLAMDASWLRRLGSASKLKYIGLLGPKDRRVEVLEMAGIDQHAGIYPLIHGPMGLDIGGDLPESVALSVIAECHQVLYKNRKRR